MKINSIISEDDGGTCSSSIAAAPVQNLFAEPQRRNKKKRVKEEISRNKPNPYTPGTWEYKNYELGAAGQGVKRSKVAQKIAKDELEDDEFFTAQEKVKEGAKSAPRGTTALNKAGKKAVDNIKKKKQEEKKPVTEGYSTWSTEKLQKFWDQHKDGEYPSPPFAQQLRLAHKELQKRKKASKKPVTESANHYMGKFAKDGQTYTLWQEADYYYQLTKSVQNAQGSFETVKTFDDMSHDEVLNWLSQREFNQVSNESKLSRKKWIIEGDNGNLKMVSAPATWTKEQVQESTGTTRIAEAPVADNLRPTTDSNAALLAKLAKVIQSCNTVDQLISATKFADKVEKEIGHRIRMQQGFSGYGRVTDIMADVTRDIRRKAKELGVDFDSLTEAPMKPVRSYKVGGSDDPAVKAKTRAADRYAKSKESKLAELRTEPVDQWDVMDAIREQGGIGEADHFISYKTGLITIDGVQVRAVKCEVMSQVNPEDDLGVSDPTETTTRHLVYRNPANPQKLEVQIG